MKKFFKTIIAKLMKLLPKWTLRNYIVFESSPDVSDNTRAVFDEMIRRGMNKKYKMVWLVDNCNHQIKDVPNVLLINKNSRKKYKYTLSSKCNICCNEKLFSWRRGQYSIYLGHGIPIKSLKTGVKEGGSETDNWLITSEAVKEIFAYEFKLDLSKGVALGYPRNDNMMKPDLDLHKYFDGEFEKVIMWYPTFRQNHGGISASDSDIALPIIHKEELARELNEFARERKVLILIKPHFAQDLSFMKDLKLENIKFIYDDFYFENDLNAYEFVGSCDALLTDYSSIYYDYMFKNKPIGLVWEDFEEYKQRPGFAVDMDFYMQGGEKIYTIDELKGFVERVSSGVDLLEAERKEICNLVHYANDANNAKRVVDYIIEKAKL